MPVTQEKGEKGVPTEEPKPKEGGQDQLIVLEKKEIREDEIPPVQKGLAVNPDQDQDQEPGGLDCINAKANQGLAFRVHLETPQESRGPE